tara:strand:+ start:768 stop:926 length:159 start_codon:yes stop_codon:yes gene_type:complete
MSHGKGFKKNEFNKAFLDKRLNKDFRSLFFNATGISLKGVIQKLGYPLIVTA